MPAPSPLNRSPTASSSLSDAAPHLLDATAFLGACSDMRQRIGARQAGLTALGWRYTLLAPGTRGSGQLDAGGLPLPGTGGERFPLRRRHLARLMAVAQPDLIEVADPGTRA